MAGPKLPDNWELRQKLENLPDNLVGEVIGGVIYTMGRPRPSHSNVEGQIFVDMREGRRNGGPPPAGWMILPEVEILFPNGESAIPDLSGWRSERVAGDELEQSPVTVTPDWVCEILSSSTRRKDLTIKRPMYAAQGVSHLWLVDPDARQLDVFALNHGGWMFVKSFLEDDVADIVPFEGTPLLLSNWWLGKR
jgi:Uma2 family endonuclease